MSTRFKTVSRWLTVLVLGSVLLSAQTAQESATISGRVLGLPDGAPVAGARVKLEGAALFRQENAQLRHNVDAAGKFEFKVPPGTYELWSEAVGYLEKRVALTLAPQQRLVQDLNLAPQELSYAYRVETVPLPQSMIPEVSGLAFTPSGALVAVNRRGEIWIRSPEGKAWRRFARGLYEPFGVVADSETDVTVIQRPEITRVRDTDGDGVADTFDTVSDDWGITGNYHEFSYGLARDRRGNFFGGLGMVSAGEFPSVRGPLKEERVMPWKGGGRVPDGHRSVAQYQGWMFQVTPGGKFIPWATGFRQPLGIGLSPEDELFVTDVSGAWVPTSTLVHVEQGKFYGHPDGLKWHPEFQNRPVTEELLRQMRVPPAVYLPRGPLGSSPGQPIWDTTAGKFGPFGGQIFIGDVTSLVMRVALEKVAGVYQGAVFPFFREQGLRIGGMRNVFAPDGSFYIAQTVRGWLTGPEGIQRIRWTGENPVDVLTMRLTERGFALTFTEPMPRTGLATPANFRIRRFQYDYHINDGSLRSNEVVVPVIETVPRADGRGVELVLLEVLPSFVYELQIVGLESGKGRALLNPTAYYTANRLPNGETTYAHTQLKPALPKALGPANPQAGESTFSQYCMVCHQADGRGSVQVGTPNFTLPDGPLAKPSDELLQSIIGGKGNIMPAFGNVIPAQDIHNVLAYLKATFGRPAASGAASPSP